MSSSAPMPAHASSNLLQEPGSPNPDAQKYFKGTPFPEYSYEFWTVHAQKCVTGGLQAHGPDMALSDPDVLWSWAGLTGLPETGQVPA